MLSYSRLLLLGLSVLLSGCHHQLCGYAIPLYQQPAGFSTTYKQQLFANSQFAGAECPYGQCRNNETGQFAGQPNLEESFGGNKAQPSLPTIATPNGAGDQSRDDNPPVYSPPEENIRSGRRDLIPTQTAPASRKNPAISTRSRLILQKY